MISISVFARMSGLSAKALRHYHDRGLLVPAQVDPDTGYRTYALAQLQDAVRISVLRRAGMSLEQVGEVLANPDRAEVLVEEFRDATRRRREAQDRALAGTARMLDVDAVAVGQRPMPEQPFVAVAVTWNDSGDDTTVERLRDGLREELTAAGVVPAGPPWTTFGLDGGVPTVVVHWPVPCSATPPDGVRRGALPERTEAFVEIPAPERNGDESVELALATLFAADPEHGVDPSTLRQTVFDSGRVEFAVTLISVSAS